MCLDRRLAEHELVGDLAVAQAARHQGHHLDLPRRQLLEHRGGGASRTRGGEVVLDDHPGDGRREQRFTGGDGAYRADELAMSRASGR